MRTISVLFVACAALLVGTASAQPILVGTPATAVIVDETSGVSNFFVDLPAGTTIAWTETTSAVPVWDVDLHFYSGTPGDLTYLGSCATDAPDEYCMAIPAGTTVVEVAGFLGVMMDVEVHFE